MGPIIATSRAAKPSAGNGGKRQPARSHQGAIGLTLCVLVIVSWLSLHVAAVFFFPLGWTTAPLVPAVVLVQCWLSVGAFIVAHDAIHGSLAPASPRLNQVLGSLILFFYAGFGWRKIRAAHMAHHQNPGTEADPDFFAGNPEAFWPWYKTFFIRYFGIRSIAFVFTTVTVYALLLQASIANIVLFYGLPALGSSLQLFYFGTYLPHRHEEADFVDHHRARTNQFGWVASLLTCFHFGYHHEHHLSPNTPWWALPGEHARLTGGTRRRSVASGV